MGKHKKKRARTHLDESAKEPIGVTRMEVYREGDAVVISMSIQETGCFPQTMKVGLNYPKPLSSNERVFPAIWRESLPNKLKGFDMGGTLGEIKTS